MSVAAPADLPAIHPGRTRRRPRLSDDQFKTLMAVLIALATIATAVAGWLQFEAATRSDAAKRRAQFHALQATSLRGSGIIEYGYEWYDAYHEWTELDLLARLAAEAGDTARAERYRAIRDRLTAFTPFLQSPYLNPDSSERPDARERKADLYEVEAEVLNQRAEADYRQNDVLDDKEQLHINHLALLTLTLSLYGFAATAGGRPRWVFTIAGSATFLTGVIWMTMVALKPVPVLPDAAIDKYAQGYAASRQGEWRSALAAYDEALAIAPNYDAALSQRANVQDELGDYEAAARDVAASIEIGNKSPFARWNLGWWNYLLGRYDEAIAVDRALIEDRPKLYEVHANLGLALLAAGRVGEAESEYRRLMDLTAEAVAAAETSGDAPPSSMWIALRHAAEDIQNLLDRQAGVEHPWTLAPPRDQIRLTETDRTAAAALVTDLKNFGVALEYTGQPPAGTPDARISSLTFLTVPGNQAPIDNTFNAGVTAIDIAFDYEKMQDGQHVVVKFSRDGQEDPVLRTTTIWKNGAAGSTRLPLRSPYGLTPGAYEVEIYVGSHLAQTGHFRIVRVLH